MKLKKSILFSVCCLCSLGSIAADDYSLYGSELSITKGTTETTFNVYMNNVETISNLQFDLYLPEGVDVYYGENEDEEMAYFISKGDRAKSQHTLSVQKHNAFYRVVISSTTNAEFKNTDANKGKPVAVVTLNINNTIEVGALDIVMKNITLAHYDTSSGTTKYVSPDSYNVFLVKPTAGVETKTSKEVLSLASAEGATVSKSDYQNAVESQSGEITAIDLRAAELGSDITSVEDLKPEGLPKNALILLSKDATITGENVVVDHVCESFKLTDEEKFSSPTHFVASTASYSRPAPTSFGTICLPFTPDKTNYTFYKLKYCCPLKIETHRITRPQCR